MTAHPYAIVVALAGAGLLPALERLPAGGAAEKPRNSALSSREFEQFHSLIKPQRGEWKFAQIDWAPTIWEARKRAAKEGMPILIWYMVGEPLGQC